MKRYKCESCEQECEPIEIDEGGYEEFWGAKVWHAQFSTLSDCCKEEVEEVEEEEIAET